MAIAAGFATVSSAQTTEKIAAHFIDRHTELLSPDFSMLSECPICLENYTTEPAVRINDVMGCQHVLWINCLNAILMSNPTEDKRCPLCRTVWIAAWEGERIRTQLRGRREARLATVGGAEARARARLVNNRNSERVQRLNRRENELNERERQLIERERRLLQRERNATQKEQRATQMIQMMQHQQMEIEAMVGRQREAIRRI